MDVIRLQFRKSIKWKSKLNLIRKPSMPSDRKLKWKNEEIITSLTDSEAAKIVESKVDSEFAKGLVSKFKSQSLSTGQLFWLHKLALETSQQKAEIGPVFQVVAAMLEKASTKLQKPRIRILAEEQQEIKLYPADSDSKYA
ncbi:hypothetical protein, partial [Ancylothrix sp. D3o]|uniref:hypothetical protein n=1 Tax=Ancylothrix sp. D3o TaxID=2953691 RepID=UPI0021BB9C1B